MQLLTSMQLLTMAPSLTSHPPGGFCVSQFLTALGVFGGSNAVWKVSTLRAYQFRSDVQTEDVELSFRVLL